MIGGSFIRRTDTQYALNDRRRLRTNDESERKAEMTGRSKEGSNAPGNERCPMCGEPVADSPYPRHRLVLEDESDADPTHHEGQVCPTCWDELRELLSSV